MASERLRALIRACFQALANMTEQDVAQLLAIPGKQVVLPFQWRAQEGAKGTPWVSFESVVMVGEQFADGLRFIAKFRASGVRVHGDASFPQQEKINVSLIARGHRIAGIDTFPGQRHANAAGSGHPYAGMTIQSTTHRHVWIGHDGYVEPVEPPLLDVIQLIERFSHECNLVFKGAVPHPLQGTQGSLL
ncbi:hypothetical protein GCM10007242_16910 [Pigmentiphaga litoralis]|nr:hypothetical protein GCM10007242_16910 [Pigmentiphaga litoralis]